MDRWTIDESRQRLSHFDDVGREHLPGLRTDIEGVVRKAGRHEEPIAGVQSESGLILDHHSHRAGKDVPNLFSRMDVPSRFDAARDFCEHLDDFTSSNRQ